MVSVKVKSALAPRFGLFTYRYWAEN